MEKSQTLQQIHQLATKRHRNTHGLHMPAPKKSKITSSWNSDKARTNLINDNFTSLNKEWKIFASKAHPRSSFINEGKAGEIYTPANTAVYAQRPPTKNTKLIELTIDTGTDKSATWGPGLALVFNTQTIKFNVGPGGFDYHNKSAFAFSNGSSETPNIKHPRNSSTHQNPSHSE